MHFIEHSFFFLLFFVLRIEKSHVIRSLPAIDLSRSAENHQPSTSQYNENENVYMSFSSTLARLLDSGARVLAVYAFEIK